MPVIQLKCPKCGGDLEFEDNREFGFCEYCGAKVMIEKNGSNMTQTYHSDVININYNYGSPESAKPRIVNLEILREKKLNQPLFGFHVYIDNVSVGKLGMGKSVTKKVSAGEHLIRITVKDFEDFETTIRVMTDTKLVTGMRGLRRKIVLMAPDD